MADGNAHSRYVKLTKDQAPLEEITPGELNQPIQIPQVLFPLKYVCVCVCCIGLCLCILVNGAVFTWILILCLWFLGWIGVCSCSVWLPRKWTGKVFGGRVENNVICVVEFIALILSLHFSSRRIETVTVWMNCRLRFSVGGWIICFCVCSLVVSILERRKAFDCGMLENIELVVIWFVNLIVFVLWFFQWLYMC